MNEGVLPLCEHRPPLCPAWRHVYKSYLYEKAVVKKPPPSPTESWASKITTNHFYRNKKRCVGFLGRKTEVSGQAGLALLIPSTCLAGSSLVPRPQPLFLKSPTLPQHCRGCFTYGGSFRENMCPQIPSGVWVFMVLSSL